MPQESLAGTGFGPLAGGGGGAEQAMQAIAPEKQGDLMGGKGGLFRRLVGGALLGLAGGAGSQGGSLQAFAGGFERQRADAQQQLTNQQAQQAQDRADRSVAAQSAQLASSARRNDALTAQTMSQVSRAEEAFPYLQEERQQKLIADSIANFNSLEKLGLSPVTQVRSSELPDALQAQQDKGDALGLIPLPIGLDDETGERLYGLYSRRAVLPPDYEVRVTGPDGKTRMLPTRGMSNPQAFSIYMMERNATIAADLAAASNASKERAARARVGARGAGRTLAETKALLASLKEQADTLVDQGKSIDGEIKSVRNNMIYGSPVEKQAARLEIGQKEAAKARLDAELLEVRAAQKRIQAELEGHTGTRPPTLGGGGKFEGEAPPGFEPTGGPEANRRDQLMKQFPIGEQFMKDGKTKVEVIDHDADGTPITRPVAQ